jgi:hypothetical protein
MSEDPLDPILFNSYGKLHSLGPVTITAGPVRSNNTWEKVTIITDQDEPIRATAFKVVSESVWEVTIDYDENPDGMVTVLVADDTSWDVEQQLKAAKSDEWIRYRLRIT